MCAILENEEYLERYHEYLRQLVEEYVEGGQADSKPEGIDFGSLDFSNMDFSNMFGGFGGQSPSGSMPGGGQPVRTR